MTLAPAACYFAQTTAFGYVKDASGKSLENVVVELKGREKDVVTDKIGYFQYVDLERGHYQLVLSQPNFETKVMEFDVEDQKKVDLGTITLYSSALTLEQGLTVLDNAGDDQAMQSSTVGLLQSSRDIFSRIASYDLGFYWYRPRGIDSRRTDTFLNGVSMAKGDDGNVDFNNWGGLNEITRYPETAVNHSPSEYAFGGMNSVVYKNTQASNYRKGFALTQSFTNRAYRYRTALRYSSGMNKNGWAFTAMGVRRWAEEGIVEGTFYDAYGAFLGIEKKFNDRHTLTFNGFVSPSRRSTGSPNTQEVTDYRGIHYNAYWGYQDGEQRSERVRKSLMPILQLQDFWKISDKSSLWTSLSYQFGEDKASRLDWQNVSNPSPAYYRRLPSYYASLNPLATVTNADGTITTAQQAYQQSVNDWTSGNPAATQLDWNALYRRNMNQAAGTYYGVNGRRALYYMVNDVSKDKIWNAATHFTHDFTDNTRFFLNISYQNYYSEQYREVSDLLGADFALNRDPFGFTNVRYTGTEPLYNVGETTVAKKVGDKIGYDYIYRRQDLRINPSLKFSAGNFDVFVSAGADYSVSSREGLFQHYLYENSKGKGADHTFWNFGLKGQVLYRLNGRNFLIYNGAVFNQAPNLMDLYINPRLNGAIVPNIRSTVNIANDLSYVLNTPKVRLRLTGYWINTENDTNVNRYFADGINLATGSDVNGAATSSDVTVSSAFVTQVMTNVEKQNFGGELGLSYKITPTLEFSGLASVGQYTYKNNPTVYFASDAVGEFANGRSYVDMGKSYMKDYFQAGTPQQAYAAGLRYSSPRFWWVGASWNYLGENYLEPNAIIRSERFVQNPVTGTPYYGVSADAVKNLLVQTKLPSAHFLNANLGKSWLFGRYYIMISGSVNNILNTKKFVTGGFEQIRNADFVSFQQEKSMETPLFSPKYFYSQGRSYFVNLQFRF